MSAVVALFASLNNDGFVTSLKNEFITTWFSPVYSKIFAMK